MAYHSPGVFRTGGSAGSSSSGSCGAAAAVPALDEPLQWIARAVRFDEGRDDAERRLQVPLETGRLYDSTKFAAALHCLQKQSSSSSARAAGSAALPAGMTTAMRHDDDDPVHGAQQQSSEEDGARSAAGCPAHASKRRSKAGTATRASAAAGPHSHGSTATTTGVPGDLKILQSSLGRARVVHRPSHDASHPPPPPPPPYALTPVVLSGLIAALQQRQQQQRQTLQDGDAEADGPADLSSDLVLACHALRRAALRRIKARSAQRRLQGLLPPLLVTLAVVAAYLKSVHKMRSALVQLRYVRSCDAGSSLSSMSTSTSNSASESRAYESACRHAETELWERYGTDLLELSGPFSSSDSASTSPSESSGPSSAFSSSLALHSVLTKSILTRHDVEAGRRLDPARHPATPGQGEGFSESTVNRLVREAVETYRDPDLGVSVLDAGCGVGGTMYSLLPLYRNATSYRDSATSSRRPRYHGITLSAAEVHHATKLMEHRRPDLEEVDVLFEQRSFDDGSLTSTITNGTRGKSTRHQRPYTVIISIESLSYSQNLRETLANLLSGLTTGGIAVIVDDVVHNTDAGRVAKDPGFKTRPSVLPHPMWDALFRENKCHLLEAYDLTFEYELVSTGNRPSSSPTKAAAFEPAYWPFSSVLNLVASSADTLWRHGVWWERWFATSGPSRRMIQLHDDQTDVQRAARKRMDEYSVRDSLSYVFYVCRKQ